VRQQWNRPYTSSIVYEGSCTHLLARFPVASGHLLQVDRHADAVAVHRGEPTEAGLIVHDLRLYVVRTLPHDTTLQAAR
jgi:hypothetical protein